MANVDLTRSPLLGVALSSRQVLAGTGLTGGGDLTADRTLAVAYGITSTTAAVGNDARITGAEQATNKGATNGYAPLVAGVVPHAYYQGATTTTDGSITLAGDLAGTYALPKLIANSWRAISGSATLTATDGVVSVTPSGAIAVITLPTPVSIAGRRYVIKKAAGATIAFAVKIATAAGNIDGASTVNIYVSGDYREVISDGTNWEIIGGSGYPVVQTTTSPANAGTLTVDASAASVFRLTPAVAGFVLAAPTNGTDGQQVNFEITPSVTFSLTITAPALTTGITSPIAVATGKKCFIGMRFSGTTWYVIAATVQS